MLAANNSLSSFFSINQVDRSRKLLLSSTSFTLNTKKICSPCSLSSKFHKLQSIFHPSRSSDCSRLFSLQDPWPDRYCDEKYEDEEGKPRWDHCVKAIVEVCCTSAEPNGLCPWKTTEYNYTGSGLIIEGRRVLTCAHVVEYHTAVKFKPYKSNTWYIATVLSVAPECDLAMLTVSDGEFWKEVEPVEFLGGMPEFGNELTIMDYKTGRLAVSVIPGSAATVKMTRYSLCFTKLMAISLNAPITEGNYSGIVFNERGRCVGVLFQYSSISFYAVAVPVINHFIEDYDKNGAYTGFPSLGIMWQKMENPNLRLSKKIERNEQGVLITEVKPNYPESEILRPYDIILSIDGINIANDGTVLLGHQQWIDFTYLITQKYKGDTVAIEVLRDSKKYEFIMQLSTRKQFKPANIDGRPHSYFVIGGLVFVTFSPQYLQCVGHKVLNREEGILQALYEERVVLSKLLHDEVNIGYDDEGIEGYQLLAFNGQPVYGLKNLVMMVKGCNEEFLEFILENYKKIVLQTKSARERTPYILKMHGIPSSMSDDLKPSL
ncbi:protease Do-like 9 [Actinidia eriantha]|uniref:protease Do-like 9 n=1 Tax=Actinidia eriantha TaxID=165200 RepID=UPI0025846B7C|nr:protease Do-like 9 [Actinidia eriantha]